MTQPAPRGSVRRYERGLSTHAAGVGTTLLRRRRMPHVFVRSALARGLCLSQVLLFINPVAFSFMSPEGTFTSQPGATPQEKEQPVWLALKARNNASNMGLCRPFRASPSGGVCPWGVAPGALGQRPRLHAWPLQGLFIPAPDTCMYLQNALNYLRLGFTV